MLSKFEGNMGTLMQDYEHQYAVLTAEITAKVGQLRSQNGDRKKLITEVDRHMEEAQELLEQMELEVRDVDVTVRPKYRTRVDSYRTELGRLSQEFNKVRNSTYSDGSYSQDEFGDSVSLNDEQKQRLLNNSERVERTGNQLKASYRIILETEEIGSQVLRDLQSQRETIQKSRSKIRENDSELGRSTRILSSMLMRSVQQRSILFGVAFFFIIIIILTVYFSVSK